MPWNAQLSLDYRLESDRTVLRFAHDGPLRVLKSLYPEGDAICHNVLVHPPGGLVQGDTLDLRFTVAPGAHGLVSTPGATRFYRSNGEPATQRVHLTLQPGARLEWLPLETIAYPGCHGRNHVVLDLSEGAELLAWDVCALGLPATGQPFDEGDLHQRLHWPGHWLEEVHLQAQDTRLLNSPLGLAGHRCLGTLWLACGTAIPPPRRDTLLAALNGVLEQHPLAASAGATAPQANTLVVRCLAPNVEPVMELFQRLWQQLRQHAWGLGTASPRIWHV
ncbi:MAG: urease accessory protein [Polaromonas sp.]|nr:urease accessory protein [Polaromonas sp.]